MDGPPSYTECHVHPSIEDCLEHALNRDPIVVLRSRRMVRCLQNFISRCMLAGEPLNIIPTKPQFRPSAPKPVSSHAEPFSGQLRPLQGTSDAETFRDTAMGSTQPAPQPSVPQPLPQRPEQQPPASPNPAAWNPASTQPHNKPNRKRKRRHYASPTTIASNSTEQSETDKDSRAELTDTEYESAPSRRRRNPPPALEELRGSLKKTLTIGRHEEDTYFQGLDISKIEDALGAFSLEGSGEALKIPPPKNLGQVTLAPDLQSSTSEDGMTPEDRMKKHIDILKCLGSKSEDTKMIAGFYDRVRVLLVKFEVDMLASRKPTDLLLPRGVTLKAYAKTKFVELWGQSSEWLKEKLRAADRLIILLENQPRYLSELMHNQTTRWTRLRNDEARAVTRYFQETDARKSPNHLEENFLICERIIQSLCFLGWTLPEIAQSGHSLLEALGKHVDLERMPEQGIRRKSTENWSFGSGEWSTIPSGSNLCGLEGSFSFNPNDHPDVSADGYPLGGGSPFNFNPNGLPDVSADDLFGGVDPFNFSPNDHPDVSADGDPWGGGSHFSFNPDGLPDVSADDLFAGVDPFALDLNHVTSTHNPEEGGTL